MHATTQRGTPTVPPGRRKLTLSDGVREAFEEQLRQSAENLQRVTDNHKMTVYLANKAGLTYDEIAEILDVSSSVIGNWRSEVAEKRGEVRRRRPDEPGERDEDG